MPMQNGSQLARYGRWEQYRTWCTSRGEPSMTFRQFVEHETKMGNWEPGTMTKTVNEPGVLAERMGVGPLGASVGSVSSEQAGILPTGRIAVSDDMVRRAQQEALARGQDLDQGLVRAILETALRG